MLPELESALDAYRSSRRFDPKQYLHAKSALLNAYFEENEISGCVVGVSGGVDSAVTLGMIAHAARQPGSPMRRILALLLPMHAEGATHQDVTLAQGAEVAAAFGVECLTIDLSSTLAAARDASKAGTGITGTAWASGQLVSYLRTPMLYYQTALLTEQGFRAILCGTTNRDEGSYIGFFGKASDGMVDLQPISDIHKSEVYQLATMLGVPTSVCEAVPTGDTYDGACDEEMIGAPYDALELYTWYLCTNEEERELWMKSLSWQACGEFMTSRDKFERLHHINKHKYIGDSPAVHLDVYARVVPGGWRSQEVEHFNDPKLRQSALAARVGPIDLDSRLAQAFHNAPWKDISPKTLADFGDSAVLLSGALSPELCDEFLCDSGRWPWVAADKHGRALVSNGNSKTSDYAENLEVFSYRATAYDENIAQLLWVRLAPSLPEFRTMDEFTPTDWNGYPVWRPVGINPMLRFIRYEKGGLLVPHYDAGFDYGDGKRHTLMSVVISLTPPSQEPGGNTRFLLDRQRFLPLDERNFADRTELASPCEVLEEVSANRGDVLVFDHRVLHDGSTWNGTGSRILLRTDIVFERIASHAIHIPKQLPPPLPPTKWARDPIFQKAYGVLRDEAAIEEAGYFDDDLDESLDSDPKWWSAPFDKILEALAQQKAQEASRELFVLVTTGAFCPIHAGHLEMMERAKDALEERGHVVLGGYFAPDHDAYVSPKCGKGAVSAALRLDLCERAVSDSNWLMVDRWAALHAPTAVNYTTIIERLQQYLAYHIRTHRPIQVVFVFGSDNAEFAKAFVGRGSAVCVLRPGYEKHLAKVSSNFMVQRNPRIIFSRVPTPPWASSNVRRGDMQGLTKEVKEEWIRLRTVNLNSDSQVPDIMNMYVRKEGAWAVQPWAELPEVNGSAIARAYEVFHKGLIAALEHSFQEGRKLEGGSQVRIVTLDLNSQKILFHDLAESSSIISLDPCLPGTANISVSRCFEPLSRRAPEFVARPGADSLPTQLDRLNNTSYVLFDDDVFSGNTISYIRPLLETKCTIEKFITLCDANGPLGENKSDQAPRLNLVDCRDFLVGAREAGLVMKLPDGSFCRAPYVLPYVRPHYHVSVFVSKEMEFSRAVWQINKEFFASVGVAMRISDMAPAFQRLCEVQGFDMDMAMDAFCDWHLKHLTVSVY